jgi:hypothetical protein
LLGLIGWLGGIGVVVFGGMQKNTDYLIAGAAVLAIGILMIPLTQFPLSISGYISERFVVKPRGRKFLKLLTARSRAPYGGMGAMGW